MLKDAAPEQERSQSRSDSKLLKKYAYVTFPEPE